MIVKIQSNSFVDVEKKEMDHIPVVANLDFGHTSPMFTFPIGGTAKLVAKEHCIKLEITEH